MRTKRAKTYKRAMAMYTRVFGFRQPYQILINDDLLLKSPPGMNLVKQLEMCVQGEIKIMITQCSIQSLYSLGPSHQPLIQFAKSFERRKCNHRLPLSSHECLTDVIGPNNKHRYILAAQAYGLRKDLEKVPGLPVVHFNPKGVLVLSPFSEASLKVKTGLEEQKRGEGEGIEVGVDKNIILPAGTGTIRSAGLGEANGASGSRGSRMNGGVGLERRELRGKRKGPNPLSVKKKKPRIQSISATGEKETFSRAQLQTGGKRPQTIAAREKRGGVDEFGQGEIGLSIGDGTNKKESRTGGENQGKKRKRRRKNGESVVEVLGVQG